MTHAPTRWTPKGEEQDDQAFLDGLFDEALARLEDGERVLVGSLLRGRESLRTEAARLLELAERVAVVRPGGWPAVNGYTILGELGRGGMGAVYLARQERVGGRPVALKVLPAGFGSSARSRERFLLEARAVAMLRHPNIVAIHDVVESSGVCAFAMEWVEGCSLSQLIDKVRETGDGVTSVGMDRLLGGDSGSVAGSYVLYIVRLGIAMARALEAVHGAGLLHRDIKPSNILIRRDGAALLSDFGLVREEGSAVHTVSGEFVGTPAYAAPEQLRGERGLDARTDVYGLGVTLYHALALRRAYEEDSIPKILARIESGKVAPLRNVSPRVARDLETIVMKAMEAEPGRRYASAATVAEELERLRTLRPIRAKPSGLATRTVKLIRRNRGRVAGLAVGSSVAIVISAAIVFLVFLAPRWHAQRVRDARIALVSDGITTAIFNRTYGGMVPRTEMKIGDPGEHTTEALRHYAAAARLPVWGRDDIRLEHEAIRLASDLKRADVAAPEPGSFLRARAPATVAYAEQWRSVEGFPAVDASVLREASVEDLRALGIVGLLTGDIELALEAWPLLDTEGGDDPLVEAALGYMYLMVDRPALAYPRLRSASESYPNEGTILVLVADAAVKVGDFERAERILRQVLRLHQTDVHATSDRIRIDLLAASGKDDEAIALWKGKEGNPLIAQRIAGIFERRGQMDRAVRVAVCFPLSEDWRNPRAVMRDGSMPRFWKYEVFLLGICDRWWDGLDLAARRAFLDAAHASDSYERYVVDRYSMARDRLAAWPERALVVLPGGQIGADALAVDPKQEWDAEAPIETLPLAGACARQTPPSDPPGP